MAEKETPGKPKILVEALPEELEAIEKTIEEEIKEAPAKRLTRAEFTAQKEKETRERSIASWAPKTEIGKKVKSGELKDIDEILEKGKKILEAEIVDSLLKLEIDLLSIGQSKGKFGGGKRRAWRQTQKKTMEGNVTTFSCMAVVGDRKGHVGLGIGKSQETLPSRDKAVRNAKLNLIKVIRGFESPEHEKDKSDPHTVPFKVTGKCGSSKVTLIPAPRGTGLVIGNECKKILRLAGIKDVYSMTLGQTRTTINMAKACVDALVKLREFKV
ncbi:30S ribosomal protein S5 [Candidatus Pacearchaeota archaeon]|nr:30S ribosomal protein S5 [Candidatus Pacearchaeota archaeon]